MTSRIRPLSRNLSRHLLSGPAAIVTTGVFVGLLVLVLWSLSDGVAPTEGQTPPVPKFDRIQSSSTTASAVVELNLTIESMPMDATSGSSVELYLEDDFQVPDSIDPNAVYFTAANPISTNTSNGRPVHAAGIIEINQGDHYGGGNDWAIRVFIPDMNEAANSGYDGPLMGQKVNLVFTEAAGIRNPSEEGTHSAGYSILQPSGQPNRGPQMDLAALRTYAKIALSDHDNTRGYELTVTGSGFNNGTSAAVFVLDRKPTEDNECQDIIINGVLLGYGVVGRDDRVAVTFEVAVPPFRPGNQNYICMVDGEGRMSQNVEQFHIQAYIRVVPTEVNVGDTITVFAHDFPNPGATLTELRIAGQVVWPSAAAGGNSVDVRYSSIDTDGTATASFEMPGSISGVALKGHRLRIDAQWGDVRRSTNVVVTDLVTPVTNISLCNGPDTGEVVISWDAVSQATHYRIGYVNMVKDYPRAKASVTGEWIEAFIYVDVNARNLPVSGDGRTQYTLRRLVKGDPHAFTVLTSNNVVNTAEMISGEYRWPRNPRWQRLTVADPESGCH